MHYTCPKCNTSNEIDEQVRFCPVCGTLVVRVNPLTHCPKCQMELDGEMQKSNFCPGCGHPLTAAAISSAPVSAPVTFANDGTPQEYSIAETILLYIFTLSILPITRWIKTYNQLESGKKMDFLTWFALLFIPNFIGTCVRFIPNCTVVIEILCSCVDIGTFFYFMTKITGLSIFNEQIKTDLKQKWCFAFASLCVSGLLSYIAYDYIEYDSIFWPLTLLVFALDFLFVGIVQEIFNHAVRFARMNATGVSK